MIIDFEIGFKDNLTTTVQPMTIDESTMNILYLYPVVFNQLTPKFTSIKHISSRV